MTMATATIHTKRWHEDTDRYAFDFKRCHFHEGWAQIDTPQDAWYFGQWANPLQLRIMTYAEGDCTLCTASNPQEFVDELRRMKAWHDENELRFAIDGMCDERIIKAFKELGLGDLLH